MSKVCHKCPLWTHVAGKHPNTDDRVDEWKCAESWQPVLLLEIAKKLHILGSEIGKMRIEQAEREVTALNLAIGIDRTHALRQDTVPQLLVTDDHKAGAISCREENSE